MAKSRRVIKYADIEQTLSVIIDQVDVTMEVFMSRKTWGDVEGALKTIERIKKMIHNVLSNPNLKEDTYWAGGVPEYQMSAEDEAALFVPTRIRPMLEELLKDLMAVQDSVDSFQIAWYHEHMGEDSEPSLSRLWTWLNQKNNTTPVYIQDLANELGDEASHVYKNIRKLQKEWSYRLSRELGSRSTVMSDSREIAQRAVSRALARQGIKLQGATDTEKQAKLVADLKSAEKAIVNCWEVVGNVMMASPSPDKGLLGNGAIARQLINDKDIKLPKEIKSQFSEVEDLYDQFRASLIDLHDMILDVRMETEDNPETIIATWTIGE